MSGGVVEHEALPTEAPSGVAGAAPPSGGGVSARASERRMLSPRSMQLRASAGVRDGSVGSTGCGGCGGGGGGCGLPPGGSPPSEGGPGGSDGGGEQGG